MTFTMNREGTNLTVAIAGNLDTLTSPELEKELEPALEGVTGLTLDLKDLEYISSAGLRVLLGAAQTMGQQGSIRTIHVQEEVMDIFRMTGFQKVLKTE